jgi:hypothetical protein
MTSTEPRNNTSPERFEQLVFGVLENEKDLYAPLEVRSIKRGARGTAITLRCLGRETRFWLEIKARTAPKIVQEAFWRLKERSDEEREAFLLVVPYITGSIREMVEREKVSCIDLSGNYLIQSPDFLAIRLDQKNRFPESASIKKIFSGNSSQVGRLFLSEKRVYKSVTDVLAAIRRRGGELSLSAISKVLQGLQDELIIEKSAKRIALLQPDRLLSRLQAEYAPPRLLSEQRLKIPGTPKEILKTIAAKFGDTMWMISGESTVEKYTMTTAPSVLRVYAAQSGDLTKYEDQRFYNMILVGTSEPYVYFDRQCAKDKVCWASRLQTYIELSRMDKRERELADSIRDEILKEFK